MLLMKVIKYLIIIEDIKANIKDPILITNDKALRIISN